MIIKNLKRVKELAIKNVTTISIVCLSISTICFSVLAVKNADADEDIASSGDFNILVEKGKITATARPNWHVNVSYPWVAQDVNEVKHKMDVNEAYAVVSDLSPGQFVVKGGVCNESSCVIVKHTVTVP